MPVIGCSMARNKPVDMDCTDDETDPIGRVKYNGNTNEWIIDFYSGPVSTVAFDSYKFGTCNIALIKNDEIISGISRKSVSESFTTFIGDAEMQPGTWHAVA